MCSQPLRALGYRTGQGWLFGRPAPVASELPRALKQNEIVPYYQPLVDLQTKRVQYYDGLHYDGLRHAEGLIYARH